MKERATRVRNAATFSVPTNTLSGCVAPAGSQTPQPAVAPSATPRYLALFSPAWRLGAVALARYMNETQDFSVLPILADALQDAGCENEAILGHCRNPGPHGATCWVVDLVLGELYPQAASTGTLSSDS